MSDGLRLEQVKITRDGKPLLSIDTHVAPGEVLTVMGPSGVGKSTLLSAIIGTLSQEFALSGQIILNGRDLSGLPPDERCVGILFQDALLFPHLSVGANLAFGLAQGGTRAARRAKIDAGLAEVGLTGFASRDPATLSGGQRARVALMRMLLSEPHALLLDEPFSGLDAELRGQVRQLVFDHARARGLPVLLVTHDQADADAADGPVVTLK
ncbi:ATP-binding cassette domain-containing protein [Aliiroseovarius sp. Z3]|uniref:ATP-binding cassette domain-containing protein n=1 Tax=Aliiroseovarius sp. Z3 TaxID=2811402 RepID=UPI0023B2F322|nr:ATP-binding cassette domain-containing protein [Aliiroseovarius sp. Z3]MDE9451662.1 ATP-binding cassette domain-containing protein [Aliiroseovarius sp. Z3]